MHLLTYWTFDLVAHCRARVSDRLEHPSALAFFYELNRPRLRGIDADIFGRRGRRCLIMIVVMRGVERPESVVAAWDGAGDFRRAGLQVPTEGPWRPSLQ